jgi:hypothetical protein
LFAAHWQRNEATVRRAVGAALMPPQPPKATGTKRVRSGNGSTGGDANGQDNARSQRQRTSNSASSSASASASSTVRAPAPGVDAAAASARPAERPRGPSPRSDNDHSSSVASAATISTASASPKPSREPDLPLAVIGMVLLRRSSLLRWCQRSDFSSLVTGTLVRVAEPSDGKRGYYTGLVTGAFQFRQAYAVLHGSGTNISTMQGLLIQRTNGRAQTVRLHGKEAPLLCYC